MRLGIWIDFDSLEDAKEFLEKNDSEIFIYTLDQVGPPYARKGTWTLYVVTDMKKSKQVSNKISYFKRLSKNYNGVYAYYEILT